MCFFKKKTAAVRNKNDRDLIEENAKAIDALLVLASADEVKTELKDLQEQIKYTTSLATDKAYAADKKIKHLIEDLKIEFVRDKEGDKAAAKINGLIKDLKLAVVERKNLI